MFREHGNFLRRLLIFVDLCIVGGMFLLVCIVYNTIAGAYSASEYAWEMALLLLIWGACLFFAGLYQSFRIKSISEILSIIVKSTCIAFFVFVGLCFVLHLPEMSLMVWFLMFSSTAMVIALERVLLVWVLRHFLRNHGLNYRCVLIVGTGPRARRLIRELDYNKGLGLKIIGLIDKDGSKVGQVIENHTVLGTLSTLSQIVRSSVIDQVFFVTPRSWINDLESTILSLEEMGIMIHIAIDHYNVLFARVRQEKFLGVPFLTFETVSDNLISLFIKRLFDIVLSAAGLAVLLPLFILTGVMIKLTSEGPVFFVQKRVGMNGRIFLLYKFRTMVKDAESKMEELLHRNEMKGPVFKITNDPRLSPIGKFLRKFSIDELPQLWNVFKGDMSLVGPRPPLPQEVERYDNWQRRRLSVRPGITCLWQIQGRNRIIDFDEWTSLDLQYIDNWSFWLDIKILFKTIPAVLFGVGAK